MRKKILFFVMLGWLLLLIGDRVDELRVYQGAQIAMYTIALASIVLLTGYSGQVSLGNGAMMAVGGYAAALTLNNLGSPVWFAFLMAIVASALFGAFLGTAAARLSGPYLAGTTLALAVGLPEIANQFDFLGGVPGLLFDVGFPPESFGQEFSQYKWFFWIASFIALLALFITSNIVLFGGVYWSKFAHMFYKPGAAIQKNLAEADGSRDNLPPLADAPKQFGLGIKREQPKHY